MPRFAIATVRTSDTLASTTGTKTHTQKFIYGDWLYVCASNQHIHEDDVDVDRSRHNSVETNTFLPNRHTVRPHLQVVSFRKLIVVYFVYRMAMHKHTRACFISRVSVSCKWTIPTHAIWRQANNEAICLNVSLVRYVCVRKTWIGISYECELRHCLSCECE